MREKREDYLSDEDIDALDKELGAEGPQSVEDPYVPPKPLLPKDKPTIEQRRSDRAPTSYLQKAHVFANDARQLVGARSHSAPTGLACGGKKSNNDAFLDYSIMAVTNAVVSMADSLDGINAKRDKTKDEDALTPSDKDFVENDSNILVSEMFDVLKELSSNMKTLADELHDIKEYSASLRSSMDSLADKMSSMDSARQDYMPAIDEDIARTPLGQRLQ